MTSWKGVPVVLSPLAPPSSATTHESFRPNPSRVTKAHCSHAPHYFTSCLIVSPTVVHSAGTERSWDDLKLIRFPTGALPA
eukprot:4713971-Amphidinium_carterae.1